MYPVNGGSGFSSAKLLLFCSELGEFFKINSKSSMADFELESSSSVSPNMALWWVALPRKCSDTAQHVLIKSTGIPIMNGESPPVIFILFEDDDVEGGGESGGARVGLSQGGSSGTLLRLAEGPSSSGCSGGGKTATGHDEERLLFTWKTTTLLVWNNASVKLP